jgi:hypothetical protein
MKVSGIQVRSKKIFCSLSDRNVTMQNITILPEERLPRFSALPLVHAVRFGLSKDFSMVAV